MRFVALVAMLLGACGAVGAIDTEDNFVEVDPPPHAEEAQAIIMDVYAHLTGDQMPIPSVRWSASLMQCGEQTCAGMTYSCDDVRVYQRPDLTGISLVLAHELAHCARGVATGDSDGGHTDPVWWGNGGYMDQAHLTMTTALFP